MSERSFRFKPIETRYNGYRFRSRLEARWAVFFDELGIEYQYEPEGYALDGIPYLPDFWLPKQRCFFEVKGEAPTEEEIEKAQRLALYVQKMVYIASGNISLPPDDLSNEITTIVPPALVKKRMLYNNQGQYVQADYEYPDVTAEVLQLLQKLHDAEMKATVHEDDLVLHQNDIWWEGAAKTFDEFIQKIRQQATSLEKIAPLLKKHQQDLIKALKLEDGWENIFNQQLVFQGDSEWLECPNCHEIAILAADGHSHLDCPKGKGRWSCETPHLIAAYTAAREARFK